MLCRSLPSPACHAISSFTEPNPTRHEPEKASIDEAFIDFTRPVRAELLARYPYLGQVPADAPNGLDTVLPPPPPILWENRGILIPIDPPCEDQAGSSSAHETGTMRQLTRRMAMTMRGELGLGMTLLCLLRPSSWTRSGRRCAYS